MNKKNNTVLFIVEGEVAEPAILNGILNDIGLCDNQVYSYKTNIYSLYNKLRHTFDDDEEYDLFTFIVDLELEKKIQIISQSLNESKFRKFIYFLI